MSWDESTSLLRIMMFPRDSRTLTQYISTSFGRRSTLHALSRRILAVYFSHLLSHVTPAELSPSSIHAAVLLNLAHIMPFRSAALGSLLYSGWSDKELDIPGLGVPASASFSARRPSEYGHE